MLYGPIDMNFLEKAKLQRQKADQWLPGIWDMSGDWLQMHTRKFLDCGDGCTTIYLLKLNKMNT